MSVTSSGSAVPSIAPDGSTAQSTAWGRSVTQSTVSSGSATKSTASDIIVVKSVASGDNDVQLPASDDTTVKSVASGGSAVQSMASDGSAVVTQETIVPCTGHAHNEVVKIHLGMTTGVEQAEGNGQLQLNQGQDPVLAGVPRSCDSNAVQSLIWDGSIVAANDKASPNTGQVVIKLRTAAVKKPRDVIGQIPTLTWDCNTVVAKNKTSLSAGQVVPINLEAAAVEGPNVAVGQVEVRQAHVEVLKSIHFTEKPRKRSTVQVEKKRAKKAKSRVECKPMVLIVVPKSVLD